MRPDYVGLGGFDSHPFPPRWTLTGACALVALSWCVLAGAPLHAQLAPAAPQKPAIAALTAPPVSPRRAFFYSAMVPGWGQAALDRRYAGAAFFLVETIALSLMHRSVDDLRLAKAFQGDSVPLRYDVDATSGIVRRDATGNPVVAEWQRSPYTSDLVHTRQLQVEDWVAVLAFNHLISGADAFVAANLWDLPQHVSMRAFPVRRGAGLAVSLRFR